MRPSSEFQAYPLNGGGAGSWQAWWLQHNTLNGFFSQYAHSLYLESLAELGILGLLLIGGAVLVAAAGAVKSALTLRSGDVAAATAAGIAFFAAAAYDWVWQLTGIGIVGVGLLGVALGALPSSRAGAWRGFGVLRPLLALVAVAAIVPQVVLLAAAIHIRNSGTAVDAGNAVGRNRRRLLQKPSSHGTRPTWYQLAKVETRLGEYGAARLAICSAIRRSPRDYNLWVAAAQIDGLRSDIVAVHRDFAEVRKLNPYAPVLSNES